MPELTDEQLTYYKGRETVANFIESIWNDPALKPEAKTLIKKKYPQLEIPDHDLRIEMNARFDKEKQEREEKERKEREAKADADHKALRKKTQDEYGFTDEAMADLEKFMIDNNVGSYDVAATYKAAKAPKTSEPTAAWDSTRWHHEKQDGFAEIAKDPEAWGRNELTTAFMKAADAERRR